MGFTPMSPPQSPPKGPSSPASPASGGDFLDDGAEDLSMDNGSKDKMVFEMKEIQDFPPDTGFDSAHHIWVVTKCTDRERIQQGGRANSAQSFDANMMYDAAMDTADPEPQQTEPLCLKKEEAQAIDYSIRNHGQSGESQDYWPSVQQRQRHSSSGLVLLQQQQQQQQVSYRSASVNPMDMTCAASNSSNAPMMNKNNLMINQHQSAAKAADRDYYYYDDSNKSNNESTAVFQAAFNAAAATLAVPSSDKNNNNNNSKTSSNRTSNSKNPTATLLAPGMTLLTPTSLDAATSSSPDGGRVVPALIFLDAPKPNANNNNNAPSPRRTPTTTTSTRPPKLPPSLPRWLRPSATSTARPSPRRRRTTRESAPTCATTPGAARRTSSLPT